MKILGLHGGVTLGQHDPGAALLVERDDFPTLRIDRCAGHPGFVRPVDS
jgi:hypothetical protein